MKFSDIVNHTQDLSIEYHGHTVNFSYFTGLLTPAFKDGLPELAEGQSQKHADAFFLSLMLDKWDVLGEDDQPIPVTYDALIKCPYKFLSALLRAINGDLENPTSASAETSQAA